MAGLAEPVAHAYSGKVSYKIAKRQSRALIRRAGQRRASGQRAANEERRDARYLASTARARAAAGGGNLSDPTLVNVFADIEAEGEYNALSRLWDTEELARGDEEEARNIKSAGKAARNIGYLKAAASLYDNATGFGGKYG